MSTSCWQDSPLLVLICHPVQCIPSLVHFLFLCLRAPQPAILVRQNCSWKALIDKAYSKYDIFELTSSQKWIPSRFCESENAATTDIDLTSGEDSTKNTPYALCNDLIPETCNQHLTKVETVPGRQVMEGIQSNVSFDQNFGHEILDLASRNPYCETFNTEGRFVFDTGPTNLAYKYVWTFPSHIQETCTLKVSKDRMKGSKRLVSTEMTSWNKISQSL